LSVPLFLITAARSPVLGICFMAGMGASGLYPVTLALAGINFPQQSGTAIGLLGTSAGIGNMVVPWLMSVISQWSSLKGGFLVAHCAALMAFGLIAVHYKRLKESEGQ
jgi:MFS family permease